MQARESVVLVEGPDDRHAIHNLLKVQLPASAITIKAKEGIANLIGTLSVELRASDLRHLAIVVDADTDNQARRPGAPKCGSSVS
jgi:5S rRNA maturation endonuclease (ribonuclease M5)